MEKENNGNRDDMELRSEKVRKLIGEVPPSLVRWGTVAIIAIFVAVVCALVFIPSPYGDGGGSILSYIIIHLW